jgi:Arv1-like family
MKRQRAPTDPTRLSSQPPKYRCLWCLTPCEALYRNLGEKGDGAGRGGGDNLQLATCHQCHEIVDPYCERELLLVAMDVVLLRPEAYRHALLNRVHLSKEPGWETTPAARIDDVGGGVTTIMALSSVLRALSLSATASTLDQPTAFIVYLGMTLLKQGVLTCLIWIFCRLRFHKQNEYYADVPSDRLALALGLPELGFSALTLLVQVWEDTATVRAMGSLLSVTCQTMALLALVDDTSAQRIRRQKGWSSWGPNDHCWMATLSIIGLSLLVRAVIGALVASCVPTLYSYDVVAAATTNYCSGLQLSQLIPHGTFRDNTNRERLLGVCWT